MFLYFFGSAGSKHIEEWLRCQTTFAELGAGLQLETTPPGSQGPASFIDSHINPALFKTRQSYRLFVDKGMVGTNVEFELSLSVKPYSRKSFLGKLDLFKTIYKILK